VLGFLVGIYANVPKILTYHAVPNHWRLLHEDSEILVFAKNRFNFDHKFNQMYRREKGGGGKHVISAYEFTIPALDIIAWASVSLTVSGRPNKI
jgi:hypothetical protein